MIADDLVERHVTAFLDLMRADSALDVFEGDVTGDPDRYTNVFHDTGFHEGHTLGAELVDVTVTFTVHSVGLSRVQAQWGSGRVTAAVLGVVPTITGRRCWRIAKLSGPPIQKDIETTPPRFLAVDRFVLKSTPAPAP